MTEPELLPVGHPAPEFTLPDSGGEPFTLSARRGSWILLWWYPKASTPGCTLEGQALRDHADALASAGCVVAGVSYDTTADNEAFRSEHGFPFPLLSDTDRAVSEQYRATRAAGEDYADFPRRVSYLIDPTGVIVANYAVTDPSGHAAEVLTDLAAAQR
ncbi:MAG: peroxiredoxin [Acidimicrobiales bacterium]